VEITLQGKTAFIAGGTSGINLGIARAMVREGARVAVLSRSQDKVDAAVAELNDIAGASTTLGFAADVRQGDAVEAAMAEAAEIMGPLDIVVSGAAGNFLAPAEALSSNAFRAVMEIDLLGTFHVMSSAFRHAREGKASFINISAPQASIPFWGQAHVCSAKAGVDMLTKTLALEWGPKGIRVNAIVPGPIANTEGMARLAATPELEEIAKVSVPSRRFGEADEVATAAVYLASDQAAYVNGAIFCVDGGQVVGGATLMQPDVLNMMSS
jgi:NAD(P)-dependent dehydrogenase (short-subunit alcohol dehydrogenase family)